jgi:uncharacterized repeat protein (TIGR01451 family)
VTRFSTKQRFVLTTAATIAIVLSAPLNQMPIIGTMFNDAVAIAQNAQRPDVKLSLTAERRKGEDWYAGNAQSANPGEILRYRLKGKNQGRVAANKFTLTQKIPARTSYVANSAVGNAEISYSVDNGKSFTRQPMIPVKTADGKTEMRPAPAEAYTNVRWRWNDSIAPGAEVSASYQVRIR